MSSPRLTSPIRTWDAEIERSARAQRRIVGSATASDEKDEPAPAAIHIPRESPFGFATGLSITEMFSIIAGERSQPRGQAG